MSSVQFPASAQVPPATAAPEGGAPLVAIAGWGFTSITRLYERFLLALGALMPLAPILYLRYCQDPALVYEDHGFHIVAIAAAILEAGFVSYVTWRCYLSSRERFLRWLTLGFLSFTVVYAPHGAFTGTAHHNIWFFLLYGPASRLTMAVALLVGLPAYGRGADSADAARDRRFWIPAIAGLLLIDLGVGYVAWSPWAGVTLIRTLETGALAAELAAIALMVVRRIRSPLMDFHLLALCYFALSSLAFLLARPWNHLWWLAHAIFAAGFFLLSYGVVRAFHTTRSFAAVYSQEEMMARLSAAKIAAEQSLQRLTTAQDFLVRSEKMAALGRLVAGVAHEINTPVGNLLTATSHLRQRTAAAANRYAQGDLDEDALLEYFDQADRASRMIATNGQRAADLIASFKQVAVDQTGRRRRVFDLATYLGEVLMSMAPTLRTSGHQVRFECPSDVIMDTDPGALSQCLTNLITNSILHAYEDGVVGTLSLTVTLPAPDRVVVIYADDGRGIPPDLRERVFEPFFTTARARGGSGLGLHIAFNAVVGALGGTMRLESPPQEGPGPGRGKGVRFIITLPRILPSVDGGAGAP